MKKGGRGDIESRGRDQEDSTATASPGREWRRRAGIAVESVGEFTNPRDEMRDCN
jgi:hypothetical protein